MTHRIFITPLANQDIDAHVNYLRIYNEKVAFRLFDAIRLTLTQIAKIPKIGVSYPLQNSRLVGLRKWRHWCSLIKGEKRYGVRLRGNGEIIKT